MSEQNRDPKYQNALSFGGELLNELRLIFTSRDREYLDKYESLTEEKRKECDEFVEYFSHCPRCNKQNPKYNLIGLFLDDSPKKQEIRKKLVKLMKDQKNNKIPVSLGVLCCECYKEIFEKEIP